MMENPCTLFTTLFFTGLSRRNKPQNNPGLHRYVHVQTCCTLEGVTDAKIPPHINSEFNSESCAGKAVIAICGTTNTYLQTGAPPAAPAEQVLIWYDR
jgi:hypothetical protein